MSLNYTSSHTPVRTGLTFNSNTQTYFVSVGLVLGTRYTVTLCAQTDNTPKVCTSFFLDYGTVLETNTAPYYVENSLQPFSVDVMQDFTFFYPTPKDNNAKDTVTVLVEPLDGSDVFITPGTVSLYVAPTDNAQEGTYNVRFTLTDNDFANNGKTPLSTVYLLKVTIKKIYIPACLDVTY